MKTIARWGIILLAAATMGIAVHHVVDLFRARAPAGGASVLSFHIAYSVYALIAALSALVIALRAWQRHEARMLAFYLVCAGFALNSFGLHGLLTGEPHGYTRVAEVLSSLAAAIGLAALVRFATIFPTDLSNTAASPASPGGFGRAVQRVQRATSRPAVIWSAGVLLALGFATRLVPFTFVSGMVCVVASAVLMLIQLRAGYRVAGDDARDKIRWLVAGAAAAGAIVAIDGALIIVYLVTGAELPIVGWDAWLLILGLLTGLLFILFAVFYRGALDPNLVIRRSVIVGVAGPFMIFLFAAAEDLATSFVAELLHIEARLATWVLAGIAAVVIAALRHRFGGLIGRVVPGPRQDGG